MSQKIGAKEAQLRAQREAIYQHRKRPETAKGAIPAKPKAKTPKKPGNAPVPSPKG